MSEPCNRGVSQPLDDFCCRADGHPRQSATQSAKIRTRTGLAKQYICGPDLSCCDIVCSPPRCYGRVSTQSARCGKNVATRTAHRLGRELLLKAPTSCRSREVKSASPFNPPATQAKSTMSSPKAPGEELEGDITFIATPPPAPQKFGTGVDCGVEVTNVSTLPPTTERH